MRPSASEILTDLLQQACLPEPTTVHQITGRGFDNEVHVVTLTDGRRVVFRRWGKRREPEHARASFFEAHGVPCPHLLACSEHASLYDFVGGTLLGDLIETGRATAEHWRMVGRAYRRVHRVQFPAGFAGEVQPQQIVLRRSDPVAEMHNWIEQSVPGLERLCPSVLDELAALHEIVNRAAQSLRGTTTSLLHGDINMWNVIVDEDDAWLIDWDGSAVGDPAMEVALLHMHASLFNEHGIDDEFFVGYGADPVEPNTSLHRVVQTIRWAASPDWASFERQSLPPDLHERTRSWLQVLLAFVIQLPTHLRRLEGLL